MDILFVVAKLVTYPMWHMLTVSERHELVIEIAWNNMYGINV